MVGITGENTGVGLPHRHQRNQFGPIDLPAAATTGQNDSGTISDRLDGLKD